MKITLSKYLILILLFSCSCQNSKSIQQDDEEFTLTGEVIGSNTKQIILTYRKNANFINDTIFVHNGKFRTKGIISSPIMAYLKGNIKKKGTSDPNYYSFFLEPKKINISLVEDKFKQAKVIGSVTQNEYERLKLVVDPLKEEVKLINKDAKALRATKKSNTDKNFYNEKLKEISQKYSIKNNEIKAIQLKYVKKHPNSYLSAYLLDIYSSKISINEIKPYYSNLSPEIKTSFYAKRIKSKIELAENSEIGKPTPLFITNDIEGEEFSLEMYKGKYVLLDFWADWCVPCIKRFPDLKSIYEKYNSKGLEIVGLSLDKNIESWKKSVKKNNINTWNHIYIGRQNVKGDSIFKSFNVRTIPALILINKDGIIEGRFLGADNKYKFSDLEQKLNEIF
ncbi:thioredoxin-like domain-containing protein [Lutibacter sp.]